jgi:hyaluronoglucosaminidase
LDGFTHRGVVEGFYGTPYSHADRVWLIQRIGAWGMNRYLYAPKDDPRHRVEWRSAYSAEQMREFAELVGLGAGAGVDVGFALSPGLSIEYSSREDVAALERKFLAFREIGSRFFGLALDDVPGHLVHEADRDAFDCLAEAHVSLAHSVADALGADATLCLVPTDYLGCEPTEYLEELGEKLDPGIQVGWTGRTVVSPEVRSDEARKRAATLRRKLLLWDNYPVTDGPMRPMLHLGPYLGRDAALPEHLSGVLLNPMEHAHASGVALRTAADFLRDPGAYHPEQAWSRAIEELGAGAAGTFADFARGHRFSVLAPEDRDRPLEEAFASLRDAVESGADAGEELSALRRLLKARLDAADRLRGDLEDQELSSELEPWLAAHHDETRRMNAAVDLLEILCSGASRLAKVMGFFVLEGKLTRITTAPVASYGARRLLYPQLLSLRDDAAGFGPDPALIRNRCLSDEFLDFAEQRALLSLQTPA